MDREPKKFITRIMETAVLLALSAFLLRLAVCSILEIWPVLLIIAIVTAGIAALWRVWKNRAKW